MKNAENHKKARQPSAPPALSRPAVFKSVIVRVTETSGDPRRNSPFTISIVIYRYIDITIVRVTETSRRNSHFGLLRAGAQRKR